MMLSVKEKDSWESLKKRDSCLDGCVDLIDEMIESFGPLNNTKFARPPIRNLREIRRSLAFLFDLSTS